MFSSWFANIAYATNTVAVGGTSVNPISRSGDLAQLVADLYDFAILTGGLLAFAVILYGAVKYTLQAGNPSALDDAKEWILQAFLGLLLLLGAWLVLNTINPEIVNITLPTLNEVRPAITTGTTYGCVAANGVYACSRSGTDSTCADAQGCQGRPCRPLTANLCGTRGQLYSCIANDNKISCDPTNKADCSGAANGSCQGKPCTLRNSAECGTTANALCGEASACAEGQGCVNGACGPCGFGNQCRAGQSCMNGTCRAAQAEACDQGRCASGYACSGPNAPSTVVRDTCYLVCTDDRQCSEGLRCQTVGANKFCF